MEGKMKTIGLLALASLTISGSAALAQQEEKLAAVAPASQVAAPKEKKICHSEKMTGSLTRVNRICMTAAEWDKLAENTNDGVNDYVKQSQRSDRMAQNAQLDPTWGGAR
jgi:hypothetical protein